MAGRPTKQFALISDESLSAAVLQEQETRTSCDISCRFAFLRLAIWRINHDHINLDFLRHSQAICGLCVDDNVSLIVSFVRGETIGIAGWVLEELNRRVISRQGEYLSVS